MPTTNPLQSFRIVGFSIRHYQAAPDAPKQPGASCDHCGTAIVNCVHVQDTVTGQRMIVGTDCAERVGLDAAEVKKLMDAKYAEQRAASRELEAAARRKARAEAEAEAAGTLGAHGTTSRFLAGCACAECLAAAPHGTLARFNQDTCTCGPCLDVALASGHFEVYEDARVVVDLATGTVLDDARIVSTQYGTSFRSDTADVWAPFTPPKRRSTCANKGYTYAEAALLVRPFKRGGHERLARLSTPIVDEWGEPIARP